MSSTTKILLVVGIISLIIGGALFSFALIKNDFKAIVGERKTTTHYVTTDFSKIQIELDTSSIELCLASDSECKVECDEREKIYHNVEVEDDKLIITKVDNRNIINKIFDFGTNISIKIFLPNKIYNNLNIKASTSNVKIGKDLCFDNMKIELSTGDIELLSKINNNLEIIVSTGDILIDGESAYYATIKSSTGDLTIKDFTIQTFLTRETNAGYTSLTNVKCNSMNINASTGKVTLINTICTNELRIKTSTGNVYFEKSDAKSIKIKTSTGNVKGDLLTPKSFYVQSSSGRVNVPKTSGEICEIETSSGNVSLKITDNQ